MTSRADIVSALHQYYTENHICGFREQAAHDSGMMPPTIPR
jgi:hypothetical protein